MSNALLEAIKQELDDVTIDDGTIDRFEQVCKDIEKAVSNKIINHEIDYYTEINKKDDGSL